GSHTPLPVSQENIDLVRRGFDAFNRADLSMVPEALHEDYELHAALYTMLGGKSTVFRGHAGYREFFQDLTESFSEFKIEVTEIQDLGERVVVIGRLSGRGRASGAEFELPIGYLIEFKDGKILRQDDYLNPEEAIDAARSRDSH